MFLGLWLVLTSFGALFLIGGAMLAVGVTLMVTGVQRGRFRGAGGGAGVVEVDERQITYFGPSAGGVMALEEIISISVNRAGDWVLVDRARQALLIPRDAEGVEALFDAFTALPGISANKLADAAQRPMQQSTVIWEKPHSHLG